VPGFHENLRRLSTPSGSELLESQYSSLIVKNTYQTLQKLKIAEQDTSQYIPLKILPKLSKYMQDLPPPSGCSRTYIKGNFRATTWFFDLRYYSLSWQHPQRKITSYICLERIFPCWKFRGDIPNKAIQSNNLQNCHKSGLNIVEWN